MSAASDYLERKVLDHVLRNATNNFNAEDTIYVALFADSGSLASTALESGTSSTSGTSNWGYYEINNANYVRQAVTFAVAATAGATTSSASNATVTFPVAGANYNTAGSTGQVVTHLAIMDAETAGNVLFYGALTTSKTVSSGDQFTISSGNLSVSLA